MLRFTENGIHCPAGDFFIDPWRPVQRAVITHAHSDHARWGSKHYLAHHDSAAILKLRLGNEISLQTIGYGEPLRIGEATVSLHPAGHIFGSAQVRVEVGGKVWVVSGDYKTEADGVCQRFEPVRCHVFITESTFGLPIYRWKPQSLVFQEINDWWRRNQDHGKVSVLCGYSLGKAQRIVRNLDRSIGKIFCHGAIFNVNEALRTAGFDLPHLPWASREFSKKDFEGALIVAPPSVGGTPWLKRFGTHSLAFCSGWMQVRGAIRRRNADVGFALSDHADWEGLLAAVRATEAETVFATHGFTSIFARYLNEIGIPAGEVKTEFGTEEDDVELENTETAESQ